MKTREGFMLRKLGNEYVVVALGSAAENFSGIIRLNEAGSLLWERLSKGIDDKSQLVDILLSTYDVERGVAAKDVDEFLSKLKHSGLVE